VATAGQVARDFHLTETARRESVRQAEVDAGERDGLTTEERKEFSDLRREKRRLKEDVEILLSRNRSRLLEANSRMLAQRWSPASRPL
jgi:transposase